MKLHRKEITICGRNGGFPTELPDNATIEHIEEMPGGSPVYVYYTVPDYES